MIIKNAKVFINGAFNAFDVEFDTNIIRIENRIDTSKHSDKDVINGDDCFLIPGLIDVHTHGAMNADASDGDTQGIESMARFYAAQGVTAWCPTTMTLKEPELTNAIKSIANYKRPNDGAKVMGVHMEGPFVSREKCGAQNPDNISLPDIKMIHRLNDLSGGLIKLITIAPEVPGALDFIKEASKEFAISVGHTTSDYATAMEAFSAGANHATHLFNAMPPLGHREPGVVGAAFDSGAWVELITDGFHISPSVIRITHKMFGDKLILISDSLRCAGMPDGDYELGGQMITMTDGKAYMKGTTTIAGSSIHLIEGLRRAVSFGIPLEDAITAATLTPAKSIGIEGSAGTIEVGRAADLVLLDKDLNVKQVFIDGQAI